jgi:hypothetical protein
MNATGCLLAIRKPSLFQTALTAAFAPDNPRGFTLTYPARLVQAVLRFAESRCGGRPHAEACGWSDGTQKAFIITTSPSQSSYSLGSD